MDDAQLRTVWRQRQFDDRIAHISQPLGMLTRHVLAKRVRQLSKLASAWDEVIPPSIRDHTALEGFNRGTLTVLVDSAPHRFQLQMLLDGGLLGELRRRFNGAIDKVRLVSGQFYSVDLTGQTRYHFDVPRIWQEPPDLGA
jgi:predicted nucleic acid-binding Zn ribbon protein